MLAIDAAAYASPWRHRHPADKAVLAFGLLGAAVALPPWPGAPLVLAAVLALLLGPARVAPRRLWRSARAPLGFAVTGAATLLVSVGGPGVVAFNPAGPRAAAELLARTVAATLALLLFAFTTPLADALPRLTRLGVPSAVVDVAALVYRMLFTLLDTARQIREAQAGRLGYATRRAAIRSVSGTAAALFVRSFARAQRLQSGLAGRGYTGALPVLTEDVRIDRRFCALSLLLVAGVVAAALLVRAGTAPA
jgi:cobalt/nickel transport system permease protein